VWHQVDGTEYAMDRDMNAQSMPSPAAERVPVGRVLIADDQQHILFALQMLLRGSGFSTETVTHPARVLDALESESFDAVLMDLNYTRDTVGGAEGLDLVSKIRALDSALPVVVMTAWSTVDLAVEAMRRGASDFVQKPWENRDLLRKLEQQLSLGREHRRKQRLHEEELRDAREIQRGLLPQALPDVAGYEIAAVNQPLRFVGGDYYNVIRMDDRHTAVCIADVAGKGMPAALLMSSLQAALQPLVAQKLPSGELCQRLNRILCDVMPLGKFISFFFGVLDSAANRLTYCNAGHNPPLMIRADGASSELSAEGAVLGQFPAWQYRQSELQMRSGDRLVLFTDGLVEACSADEEAFGEVNVIRVARENRHCSAQQMMGALMRAASEHCHGHFQDDASVIVLKAF
jgi:sigma-B regulation protein RsbU (phosphoserine phosphatase)